MEVLCDLSQAAARYAHTRMPIIRYTAKLMVSALVHTTTDYTDVNKTSVDINEHTEQRLKMPHLAAINQHIRQKSQPTVYIICKHL
jgi:hypothetical protein